MRKNDKPYACFLAPETTTTSTMAAKMNDHGRRIDGKIMMTKGQKLT
uniref:Uncharacterized protein n=1 Tax=Romanomermis culicivorax TaxID=13658 RepID=A0A915I322_ROMCU